jgi:radical SAM-linked protein
MLAVFEKGERIRHIGHLDIQRSVQRGLRRSGLPVAYSQGFNPHILITFASALSTGACGKREIMDVTMAGDVEAEEFLVKMNRAMPPEMQLKEARAVDNKHPSLMGMVAAADYDLLIRDEAQGEKLAAALPEMMKKDQIMAMRKTKTKLAECDIKPLIYSLYAEKKDGKTHLRAMMTLTERESCKPQMLLEALKAQAGIEAEVRMLVTREGLYGLNETGALAPLENM